MNITNIFPYGGPGGSFGTGTSPAQPQFNPAGQWHLPTSHVSYQPTTGGWEHQQMGGGAYSTPSDWQASAPTQTLELFPSNPTNGGRTSWRRSLSRSPDTRIGLGGANERSTHQYPQQSVNLTFGGQSVQSQGQTTASDRRRSRSRSSERLTLTLGRSASRQL